MYKVLLVVTTFNEWEETKNFLDNSHLPNNVELLFIDDCSTDATVEHLREAGLEVIAKSKGAGLTHSWNLAIEYFRNHPQYDILIIANNDIIIPQGSLDELCRIHQKWNSVCVVPLTSARGCGHQPLQNVDMHYEGITGDVQAKIFTAYNAKPNEKWMFDPVRIKYFSGFFFSLKRRIFEISPIPVFDPAFLNYKNEDEFNWKVLIPADEYPCLAKTVYIEHKKAASFGKLPKDEKQTNNLGEFLKLRK